MKRIPLKTARKRAELTQAALAAKIGKPQSFIAKLETGVKKEPLASELVALGKALGVDPLALTFGTQDATS
jgi:transcriptional regulator with XRE-family HTH domain